MKTRDIVIGDKKAAGFEIDLPGAPLLLARGQKGFLMCGYLNVAAAEKFGQAAAVVRGVKTLDELLTGTVTDTTKAASALGVTHGMTGRSALEKFL